MKLKEAATDLRGSGIEAVKAGEYLGLAIQEMEKVVVRKPNLVVMDFDIDLKKIGIGNFEEGVSFKLGFGMSGHGDIYVVRAGAWFESDFKAVLAKRYGVEDSDYRMFEYKFDMGAETLFFTVVFVSGKNFETKYNSISYITGGGNVKGYGAMYHNKMYIRNLNVTNIPAEFWNYPLRGFAIPYNVSDVGGVIRGIVNIKEENGEHADLRYFGEPFKNDVGIFVEKFKGLGWSMITSKWGKSIKNANGSYREIKYRV